ncbi:MAG: ribonuclease P protein component [Zymomonas mobilis subsp. pomaceae]|uniref:ribonuclease P protein component n=1 Tax=Zymomonas mobilis TaxID=542 RepID=UPI0009B68613|nr:ribonuclease P protein component [Zymomonas mobilis]MDX5948065.1 ribonuclease P protein component [Zymomonas mobilis subsp. pomaceae]
MSVLKRRADFLAANRGKRVPMPGFILLVYARNDGNSAMRVGYTVTKKTGNAVVRNRIKRRFRALVRSLLPKGGIAGADHILIGRRAAYNGNYDDLMRQLSKALARMRR